MILTDIFNTLADYLNFAIDFISWRAITAFRRLDKVNAELVSYFITGLILAFVISYTTKVPTYIPQDTDDETQPMEKADRGTPNAAPPATSEPFKLSDSLILGAVLLTLVGPILFHLVLVPYNRIYHPYTIGSMKDTMNAFMAALAIYMPVNALATRVQRGATSVSRRYIGLRFVLLFYIVVVVIAQAPGIYLTAAWIQAIATVHGTPFWYMIPPTLLLAVPLGALILWGKSQVAKTAETSELPAKEE